MRLNRDRDVRSTALAGAAGWTVVRVWECSVQADPHGAATAVLSGVSPPPAASRPTKRRLPKARVRP